MEKSPKNMEGHQLRDVVMAQGYVRAIGGKGQVKVVLDRVYKTLAQMFPHANEPRDQWTERRVRALWGGEAARVEFREMVELHKAAEKAKEQRALLREARKEHAEYVAQTASLRALLEHQDEAFHSPQIEGLRGMAGRVDRTRAED
jgi:hypothetical protein